jgi:hypothetical protein
VGAEQSSDSIQGSLVVVVVVLHDSTANMGSGKKEANRKERQGLTGDGMANIKLKGENFYR